MMKTAGRLLILVACGLTVPPPGWCCAAARWLQTPAQAQTKAAPACCCCPAEAPAEEPPAPPVRASCCERDPADPPRPVDVDAPAPAFVEARAAWRAVAPGVRVPSCDVVVPDDPLFVLHCVWRC